MYYFVDRITLMYLLVLKYQLISIGEDMLAGKHFIARWTWSLA